MVETFKTKLARLLFPQFVAELERRVIETEGSVNMRVADILSKMDPFEPLMREYHGIFSQEFEHPEDKLDARGQLGMKMWGYQQSRDPHFEHFINWIMDTQANETLKRAPITEARIQYGRAQISNMVLVKREIDRLALLYEEELDKHKVKDFDENVAIE